MKLTPRDIDILQALDRWPLTARQLLKLSASFALPFSDERLVRRRLSQLCAAGQVHRARLSALAGSGGAPVYYRLSYLGYRILYGPEVLIPSKRYFSPIALSHQPHAFALSELLTHVASCAVRRNVRIEGFCRQNSVRLESGADCVYPDAAFQLVHPAGERYSYFIELDNFTERIHSQRVVESWEQKIRAYEGAQDRTAVRFRVLVVTTRDSERLGRILDTARVLARNPDRSLVYGCHLPRILADDDPIGSALFRTHRGDSVPMMPSPA